jgi:hypothetical protein
LPQSKFPYPSSKERLFSIAEKYYGMSLKQAVALFKAKSLPIPFDEFAWEEYITAISGSPVCLVCSGPTRRESRPVASKGISRNLHHYGLLCLEHGRTHQIVISLAQIRAHQQGHGVLAKACKHVERKANRCFECEKEFLIATKAAIPAIMGGYCRCGNYLYECAVCFQDFFDITYPQVVLNLQKEVSKLEKDKPKS